MKALRITVGLTLALIVASANAIAAYGYRGGAVFEVLFSSKPADDPRWTTTPTEDGPRHQPRMIRVASAHLGAGVTACV